MIASAPSGGSEPVKGRSQRSFWASSPSTVTGSAKKPLEVIRLPIPAHPCESSSWTMQAVRQSVIPSPPYSAGTMNDVRPSVAALRQIAHGTSVSASSTARDTGRISFAANSRQSRWISSCSSFRSTIAQPPAVDVPLAAEYNRRSDQDWRRGRMRAHAPLPGAPDGVPRGEGCELSGVISSGSRTRPPLATALPRTQSPTSTLASVSALATSCWRDAGTRPRLL